MKKLIKYLETKNFKFKNVDNKILHIYLNSKKVLDISYYSRDSVVLEERVRYLNKKPVKTRGNENKILENIKRIINYQEAL